MTHPRTALKRLTGRPLAALLRWLARLSSRRAGLALGYHLVGHPEGDPRQELVPALGSQRFDAQVRHLASHYRLVRASELPEQAARRRRGQRFPVAITFDDDLQSHHAVAAPILGRHGAPATFFLCGASLARAHEFWWERLQRIASRGEVDGGLAAAVRARGTSIHEVGQAIEALSPGERDSINAELADRAGPPPAGAGLRAGQIRELADAGFEIGFHTRRHDPLAALPHERLDEAMTAGRTELAEAAGREVTVISYPHGSADRRVAAAARRAGYHAGYTNRWDPVRAGDDGLLLGRLTAPHASGAEFALAVIGRIWRYAR